MAGSNTGWATGFLLLACAGLGGIVALETIEGLPLAPSVTAAAPSAADLPTVPEPAEFRPPPQDQFDVIAARPLFSPSRRPYEPPPEPEAELPEPEPEVVATPLELVGVFLADGRRSALLLPENETEASWVREGEELAGWWVERVELDLVELRQRDRLEVVELRPDGPAGATAQEVSNAVERPLRKSGAPDAVQGAVDQPDVDEPNIDDPDFDQPLEDGPPDAPPPLQD